MGRKRLFGMGLMIAMLAYQATYAQEEESAEVYLEEYTDEFQENFFEALKQKGIQNYDRAIALLLKCKQLEPSFSVVDYELGKAYLADKQYVIAQGHAIDAINQEPTDFWYLENLLSILESQGNTVDAIEQNIPFANQKLQENLALAYFKKKKYQEALGVLSKLDNKTLASQLRRKINDSLSNKAKQIETPSKKEEVVDDNPVTNYQKQLQGLIEREDYNETLRISREALDAYPLQPYFYYALGVAMNATSNANGAIEILEGGLDYLLDDDALANKMYKELSRAYTEIGNMNKANEYANKIKPGL